MGKTNTKNQKQKGKRLRQADLADRHALYEESVQNVEGEFEFVNTTFQALRGREPHLLREDFCGTAAMCCEWVRQSEQNRAWGVDLDPEVLQWGRANNLEGLSPEQQERVNLIQDDVMKVSVGGVDVVVAMNFSYMILEDRDTLRTYFARVRDALADDGVFFLDAFGGYDAFREMKERTRHKGFTYVWEQASYNPIDGHMVCYIHFHFPDKSKLKKAFRYEWRLWTLPELQELLKEAGFSKVTVYWQGWDEDDEPDGDFKPATVADADAGWIAYLSAEK